MLQRCECGQRYAVGLLRCPARGCGIMSPLFARVHVPAAPAAVAVPAPRRRGRPPKQKTA